MQLLTLHFFFPLTFTGYEIRHRLLFACAWHAAVTGKPLAWFTLSIQVGLRNDWELCQSSQNSLLFKNLAVPPTGKCRESQRLSRELQGWLALSLLCKRFRCQCRAPLMSRFPIDIKGRSACTDNAEYLRTELCPETTVFDSYCLLILTASFLTPLKSFPKHYVLHI